MMGLQHTWWRIAELDAVCSWYLNQTELAAAFVVVILAVVWTARQPRAGWAALGWMLTAVALCGAGNGLTLVSAWMLSTVATLLLFRWSTDGNQRGLYTFALAGAVADSVFLLGYLFYCTTYRDGFLPTDEQFQEASVALTNFPAKAFALSALGAALARLAVGAGSLWLPGEPRLQAREFFAQRLLGLLLPCLVLLHKLNFLRHETPTAGIIAFVCLAVPGIVGALLHTFGSNPPSYLNPARWFEELVEKPLKGIITFVDRRLEIRTVGALFLFPSRLARAGGVWISLLQSGSLASYLTFSAFGMAALLAWALWGGR